MEYIYLLQREADIKYNVFKAGMSTKPIVNRIRAADYRRANIYLIRGVSNSKLVEDEIFKTLKNLGFIQAKIAYLNKNIEFGKEDYVIKNNIYEVVDIINKICDNYKFIQNDELSSSAKSSETETESEIEIDSLDSSDSDFKDESSIKINNNEFSSNISNVSFVKINLINPNLNEQSPPILEKFENNQEIPLKNEKTKIKVDYEHFKQIFENDKLLYNVKDKSLFKTYYDKILDTSKNVYSIETIMNITEIIFDRLYLKRSPKIPQSNGKSIYLTQVVMIDKSMFIGINNINIYDPLSIHFYIPNAAFKKDIERWEISGVLENPIKLKAFRCHGYNCYAFDN